MSFVFDGVNDGMQNTGTPPVVNYGASGFTMACWYKRADTSASARTLMHLGQAATINNGFSLVVGSGGDVTARARDGTTSSNATTTTTANDTNWHHAAAVYTSATSRAAYIDGANKGTNTASRSPTDATIFRLGIFPDDTGDMNGNIAHAAKWNIALSDSEIASLAAGANPLAVQNAHLVWYAPLQINESPAIDVIGGYNLTALNQAAYSSSTDPVVNTFISSVDSDNSVTATQQNWHVLGVNFGTSGGSVKVIDQGGTLNVTLNEDSRVANDIQCDMSIGTTTGIRYGTATCRVANSLTGTSDKTITITAPSGVNYVVVGTPAADNRLTASTDIASGDQIEWSNVQGTGMTIADVTVYADGSFSFTPGVTSFDFRVHNQTDGWGSIGTISTAGLLPDILTTVVDGAIVGQAYLFTFLANGDPTLVWDISSGSLPSWAVLDADLGLITGIPDVVGDTVFTVRATNDYGTDTVSVILSVSLGVAALGFPRPQIRLGIGL